MFWPWSCLARRCPIAATRPNLSRGFKDRLIVDGIQALVSIEGDSCRKIPCLARSAQHVSDVVTQSIKEYDRAHQDLCSLPTQSIPLRQRWNHACRENFADSHPPKLQTISYSARPSHDRPQNALRAGQPLPCYPGSHPGLVPWVHTIVRISENR